MERTADSGPWPCDAAGAAAVTLIAPERGSGFDEDDEETSKHALTAAADLESHELQDLVDVLPDIVSRAAGVPLKLHLRITLGDGAEVPPELRSSLNELLEGVNANLRLKE